MVCFLCHNLLNTHDKCNMSVPNSLQAIRSVETNWEKHKNQLASRGVFVVWQWTMNHKIRQHRSHQYNTLPPIHLRSRCCLKRWLLNMHGRHPVPAIVWSIIFDKVSGLYLVIILAPFHTIAMVYIHGFRHSCKSSWWRFAGPIPQAYVSRERPVRWWDLTTSIMSSLYPLLV